MLVKNDIVMGMIQADLHERFGRGWSIDVMEYAKDDRGVVLVRIRHGHIGDAGAVAANAHMFLSDLKDMVEGKCIQEQVHEAIGGEWSPPYYFTKPGLNACKEIYDRVITHIDHYAWTEQNNPE